MSIFANVSRSYEPPILGELTSFTTGGGFLPLDALDSAEEAARWGKRAYAVAAALKKPKKPTATKRPLKR